MKLYFHPKSPNATAVLAVAYELGIALNLQEVNLPGGEQRQPAFLKINPNGKVPALEDGDFVLWESGALIQYLAAQKPGNSIWPADDRVRADITRWQLWRMGEWGRGAGREKKLNFRDPNQSCASVSFSLRKNHRAQSVVSMQTA